MAAFVLTATQKVAMGPISAQDAKGNPAPIDGAPSWSSSNTDVLILDVDVDGLNAVAKAVGPIGTAQVVVTADADLGAGVVPIMGTLDFQVVAGQAVALSIPAGQPEEQGGTLRTEAPAAAKAAKHK